MSFLETYEKILTMSDKSLMDLIDRYNKGLLGDNTRRALEIIDGGIGLPGESIVGTLNVGVAA